MRFLFLLDHSVCHERMGIMQLSAIARAHGHETLLRHADSFRGFDALAAFVRAWGPQVLCYSLMTREAGRLLPLNRRLRGVVDALSIAGGPHPTFRPECLEEEPSLDAICIGEGDGAFEDLCRLYPDGDWRSIANLHVRTPEGIRRNPLRPLVADLDRLPVPDRGIVLEESPRLARENTRLFHAARGCPHACAYCYNASRNRLYEGLGAIVRSRTVPHVVAEIAEVGRQTPMRYVCFGEDHFLARPREWFERLASAMEGMRYRIICNVRPDAVTEERIRLLARAGLYSVWMGVECGDEEVSRTILGRDIPNERVLEAAAIFHRHGVRIVTMNVMCLPVPDPLAVDRKTLALNRRIRPVFAWSSMLFPYPGTAIERYCRERGYLPSAGVGDGHEALDGLPILAIHRPEDVARCVRHQLLFGLFVESALASSLTRLLTALPLTTLYRALFYLWYGYCAYFRIRPGARLKDRLPSVRAFASRFVGRGGSTARGA